MKKIDLEKNSLDLEYQKNLQYLNAVLIIGAGSLIVYLSSLILNLNQWFLYSLIIAIIGTLTSLGFFQVNKNLQKISLEIENLRP